MPQSKRCKRSTTKTVNGSTLNKILYPSEVSEVEQISQQLAWVSTAGGEVVESDSIEIGTIEPKHEATVESATVETVSGPKPTSDATRLFQLLTPAYTWCDETTFQATNDTSESPSEPQPHEPRLFHADWTAQHKREVETAQHKKAVESVEIETGQSAALAGCHPQSGDIRPFV